MKHKHKVFYSVLIVLLLVSIGASFYLYRNLKSIQTNSQNQALANDSEVKETVEKLGKILMLPSDETPVVLTVSDPAKLQNQPFFSMAKEGYKVVVYQKSKKAILYDSVQNKIIEVASITVTNNSNSSSTSSASEKVLNEN